eukprot:405634_1
MAPMLYGGDATRKTTDAKMPDSACEVEEEVVAKSGSGDETSTAAAAKEGEEGKKAEEEETASSTLKDASTGETLVDPFLWLDFNLKSVEDYTIES